MFLKQIKSDAMKTKDIIYRLVAEYISKIKACDECFAATYCTINGLRESQEPCADQEKCINNCINYLRSVQHHTT